jgi:hypothetical protein
MKFFRTRAMGQLTSLAPGSDNRCCSAWGWLLLAPQCTSQLCCDPCFGLCDTIGSKCQAAHQWGQWDMWENTS